MKSPNPDAVTEAVRAAGEPVGEVLGFATRRPGVPATTMTVKGLDGVVRTWTTDGNGWQACPQC